MLSNICDRFGNTVTQAELPDNMNVAYSYDYNVFRCFDASNPEAEVLNFPGNAGTRRLATQNRSALRGAASNVLGFTHEGKPRLNMLIPLRPQNPPKGRQVSWEVPGHARWQAEKDRIKQWKAKRKRNSA